MELGCDLGQLHENDVTQLILGMMSDSDRGLIAIGFDLLVFFGVTIFFGIHFLAQFFLE